LALRFSNLKAGSLFRTSTTDPKWKARGSGRFRSLEFKGDLRDTMIASIALANHAVLATRNVSHFADRSVPVVNPWAD